MVLRTVHETWRDHTSSSPSIDPSSTPWKRASRNSSKRFIEIQRSDRKLSPFQTVHQAWIDQTSSAPSIDPLSTTWKRASGNSSKSLIAIQRSDRKLWPFRTVTQARRDQTSSSPSIDSISTSWNGASGNSSKSLIAIQRLDRKLWLFEPSIKPGRTRPHHHRVSIPHPPHGKGHPQTPVKFHCYPTVGSKVMALSNRQSSVARPDLIITEYRFLIHSMEKCIRKLQ